MTEPPKDPGILQSTGKTASQSSAKAEGRSWTLLSPQGVAFGIALLVVGYMIWRFKHVRGIGDGVLTASLVVLLANALQWVQRKLEATGSPLWRRISKAIKLSS